MPNRFDPTRLVTLPRLDAAQARSLARSLQGALDEAMSDPELLVTTRRRLERLRTGAMRLVRNERIRLGRLRGGDEAPAPSEAALADQSTVRALGRDAVQAWGAIENVLAGWARTPRGIDGRERARSLHELIFAEGLAFTQLPVVARWGAAERKLALIDQQKLDVELAAIGAAPLLAVLREVHAALADALRTTGQMPSAAGPRPSDLRLTALLDAIRRYVIAVSGLVAPGHPTSARLAGRLLQPLTDLDRRSVREPPVATESSPLPLV